MGKIKIAIVGASGLVGLEILKILKSDNFFENVSIDLFASDVSSGQKVVVQNNEFVIQSLSKNCTRKKYDIVFFSAGEDISLKYAKLFAKNGAFVIDNSNAFRRDENVPLVVPEINGNLIDRNKKIIANPNCSTIQLVIVICRLLKVANIKNIVVSTYQSVSGAGKVALQDLKENTSKFFKKGITNNIIPQIGDVLSNKSCVEEDKITYELNKILNTNLKICATTVRVPIAHCHGESVYVEFSEKVEIADIKKSIKTEYIKFSDNDIFYPAECAGKDEVYVCRLRKVSDNEILFFEIADNLRRGAGYNATQIAKVIISKFYKKF